MSVIPLYAEQQTFFVPAFEVKRAGPSGGMPFPDDILRAAVDVKYEDSIDNVDSFTIVFNNWNADTRKPLFLGGGGAVGDADKPEDALFEYVQPGAEIQLLMGYEGRTPDLRLMTTAFVKTLEADFPESGAPRLTVCGLNVLDRFRDKQYTWAWPEKPASSKDPQPPPATITDSEIAKSFAREPDPKTGKPGLGKGIAVEIDPRGEAGHEHVMMNNEYPLNFLMRRARRNGYDLYLGTYEQPPGSTEPPQRYLYFGPSRLLDRPTYLFERGKSLVSLRATISMARQVKKVTVMGWDRATQKPIQSEATLADVKPPINEDLHAFITSTGRDEVVADDPVYTIEDAKRLAVGYLEAQALEMVEATGVVPGLPDLRAGSAIEIAGFDKRLDGHWFVKQTTHTINDSGYRTSFVARRERPRVVVLEDSP